MDLKSFDSVFTLLTAIIKKEGGTIRITEEELNSVKKTDLVALSWDSKNNEAILSIGLPQTSSNNLVN
tara:strand:+ start:243 stop:446 length:204 start_codon:yes stop_codon:yes gene_type:complete